MSQNKVLFHNCDRITYRIVKKSFVDQSGRHFFVPCSLFFFFHQIPQTKIKGVTILETNGIVQLSKNATYCSGQVGIVMIIYDNSIKQMVS